MNRKAILYLAVVSVCILAVVGAGCQKLKARDQLNKGVLAYKNASYRTAVEHFKVAVELDPTFATARLYLATAYMSQYIPGSISPENVQMAQAAEENFMEVVRQDPSNTVGIASLASLYFNQASGLPTQEEKLQKLDEAAEWYDKLISIDPNNKEAYYTLGVIAWSKWYPVLMGARAELFMRPEDPGPLKDKAKRAELREGYATVIEEGLESLNKALEIDEEYDDAMAYLNLLYRERADLAETTEEYEADIATADDWLQKSLDMKKIKLARTEAKGGVVLEGGGE